MTGLMSKDDFTKLASPYLPESNLDEFTDNTFKLFDEVTAIMSTYVDDFFNENNSEWTFLARTVTAYLTLGSLPWQCLPSRPRTAGSASFGLLTAFLTKWDSWKLATCDNVYSFSSTGELCQYWCAEGGRGDRDLGFKKVSLNTIWKVSLKRCWPVFSRWSWSPLPTVEDRLGEHSLSAALLIVTCVACVLLPYVVIWW